MWGAWRGGHILCKLQCAWHCTIFQIARRIPSTSVNGCMRRSMLTARRMELHADQHQWGCCDGLKHGATHFSVSASFSFADMWVADMLASALKKHTVLSFHYHAAQLTHSSFECLTNGCPPVEVGLLIQCQAGSERVRALE
jgi:hypothetical protein